MQDNQLKIERLEKNSNEETTGGCRTDKKNDNDRRDERVHMPRDDDDEIVCRIKEDLPTFDDVHDPKVFSDWLVDMDYYFD